MFAGRRDREPDLGGCVRLEPVGRPLVAGQETIDLEALGAEDRVEPIMGMRVTAFLAEEAADRALQLGIVEFAQEVLHRAHEEPLAMRKQQVDTVGDRSGRCVVREPVSRDRAQVDVEVADDRLHGGLQEDTCSVPPIDLKSIITKCPSERSATRGAHERFRYHGPSVATSRRSQSRSARPSPAADPNGQ